MATEERHAALKLIFSRLFDFLHDLGVEELLLVLQDTFMNRGSEREKVDSRLVSDAFDESITVHD